MRYCISSSGLSWEAAKAVKPSLPLLQCLHSRAHAPQSRSSNRTPLSLCSHHCHVVSACPGNGLPGWPPWQERYLSPAWLGTPRAVNNGTKPGILSLLWKWAATHFAASPCLGCFYCFPKNQLYCKSQITNSRQMLLGWRWEQGLEARTEQEMQRERVLTVLSERCNPPLLKHLSYASPACLCTRAANWAKSRGDFVRPTNVG